MLPLLVQQERGQPEHNFKLRADSTGCMNGAGEEKLRISYSGFEEHATELSMKVVGVRCGN